MGNELQSENDVIEHLSDPTPRPGRLCPLLNHEDNTLHIGMSVGMGGFDVWPAEWFGSMIANTVNELYEAGRLTPKGEPRTVHVGSPLFMILEYRDEKEF
jgi:hypothetical protein